MADTVRYHMEEMVPELEDLQRRGFFSAAELKQIAAKRTDFEYLLKRRAPLKADFLRYIEYEKQVEALRVLRKKTRRLHGKASLADHTGVRRIHFLFERATRKFAGDLRMWTRWLAYCHESGSTRRVSRVLTKALQLHPTAAGLWSAAAAWELQANGNAAAARALMQRGLRLARDSRHLWTEYFRLELTYAARLAARRRMLGIDGVAGATVSDRAPEAEAAAAAGEADQSDAALQAVLGGAVARVVYRSAVAAIPDDVTFRREFLEALAPFSLPGIPDIEEEIYSSIAADFAGAPEAVDIAARRHVRSSARPEQLQAAVNAYQQALQERPSKELADLYIGFLTERLQRQLEASSSARADSATAADGQSQQEELAAAAAATAAQLLAAYEQAADAGCASEETWLVWPALALRCGHPEAALASARRAALACPASVSLRRQALVLQAQHCTLRLAGVMSDGDRALALRQLETSALAAVTPAGGVPEAAPVWLAALEALASAGAPLQQLLERLVLCCLGQAKGPVRGGMGEVAAAAVEAAHVLDGIGAARALWRRLAVGPPPGGELFVAAGRAEAAAVAANEVDADASASAAAFEAGVAAYGAEDWELWLEYAQFAQASQSVGRARNGCATSGELIQRGRKALRDPEAFSLAVKELAL